MCPYLPASDQHEQEMKRTLGFSRLLLLSILEIHDRNQGVSASRHRAGPRGRPSGQRKREYEVLYGRRLERSRGTEARI